MGQRRTLWLGGHRRSEHQLSLEFGLDEFRFSASYWYGDVDLPALEERYGVEVMQRLYFHIAAFTASTLVSLRPDVLDLGPYARFCTPAFWTLWQQVVHGVWAQWRYEHDEPDYLGPEPLTTAAAARAASLEPIDNLPSNDVSTLAFFGGGKDSVVALRLLERAGTVSDTLVYSSTAYGNASRQHELCDRALDALRTAPRRRRRIWALDDVADSPLGLLHPGLARRGLTAAETPTSLFVALPLVLQYGYRRLSLGHERSADTGNLVWARTGEEINHQWGKSTQCQRLLAQYVHEHLVADCTYFSPLKPAYDPLVLSLLAADLEAVPFTQSCNVAKPWCGRCAKCAYVWLCYRAYLPGDVVDRTFTGFGNLLDNQENQQWYKQLLGLAEHTPFECVGGVEETRLAFELCRRRGLRGTAMELFEQEVPPVDVDALLAKYLAVDDTAEALPPELREPLLAALLRGVPLHAQPGIPAAA